MRLLLRRQEPLDRERTSRFVAAHMPCSGDRQSQSGRSHLGLADRFGENTSRYWRMLQDRPGFQRAQAAQLEAAERQGVPPTPAPLAGRQQG